MFRRCCVPQCNSSRKDVLLHRFPCKSENQKQWLKFVKCENNDVGKLFVCHKHFEHKFVNTTTNRLKSGAYPSLFTEQEISSGKSNYFSFDILKKTISREHNYSIKCHIDHSYALQTDHTSNQDACLKGFGDTDLVQPSTSSDLRDATSLSVPVSQNKEIEMTSGLFKTPKKMKKRVARNVKTLTPRCKLLYQEYRKARLQTNYILRSRRALVFSKEESFEELTNSMSSLSKKVLLMQIKLCTRSKNARRFTLEEKLIALSIYKQGPKCYRFLQKVFILPSKTTLKNMMKHVDIGTGINPQIFELLKNQVKDWDLKKKICTVMFDEMALESSLTYSTAKDEIVGFVDLNGKTTKFADHTLVLMLRGAVHKWQQPLAFYFCESATQSLQLKQILKEVIAAVTDTGLLPIALVSDQGTNFQSAISDLLEDTKREQLRAGEQVDNTIHLSGNQLSVFYDPPHLIKGIRNNFLSKDMSFRGKIAKWQDIVDVYNADCKHGESRFLHKVTDQHVIPRKVKKMKMKNCVQVISKSVSAALSYISIFPLYPDGTPVSTTLKNTLEAISFFDDLFDSVNGVSASNKTSTGKYLRKAITPISGHINFWKNAIDTLNGVKFVSMNNNTLKSVPSLKNWVITLKSFQRVWDHLKSKNIYIMRPRYFNSDPIENFFGQVRAYNYRSNDANCNAFVNTFKSLLVTRFINFHSDNFNCQDFVSKDLLPLQSLFTITNTVSIAPISEQTVRPQIKYYQESIAVQARRERLNVHCRAYTTGWVTRKILKKIKCQSCKKNLITRDETNIHTFVNLKEYHKMRGKKLSYPSENAVRCFTNIVRETNEYLEHNSYKKEISKNFKEYIFSIFYNIYNSKAVHF